MLNRYRLYYLFIACLSLIIACEPEFSLRPLQEDEPATNPSAPEPDDEDIIESVEEIFSEELAPMFEPPPAQTEGENLRVSVSLPLREENWPGEFVVKDGQIILHVPLTDILETAPSGQPKPGATYFFFRSAHASTTESFVEVACECHMDACEFNESTGKLTGVVGFNMTNQNVETNPTVLTCPQLGLVASATYNQETGKAHMELRQLVGEPDETGMVTVYTFVNNTTVQEAIVHAIREQISQLPSGLSSEKIMDQLSAKFTDNIHSFEKAVTASAPEGALSNKGVTIKSPDTNSGPKLEPPKGAPKQMMPKRLPANKFLPDPVPLASVVNSIEGLKSAVPGLRYRGLFQGLKIQEHGHYVSLIFESELSFKQVKQLLESQKVHLSEADDPYEPGVPQSFKIAKGQSPEGLIVLTSHLFNPGEKKWAKKTTLTVTQFLTSS